MDNDRCDRKSTVLKEKILTGIIAVALLAYAVIGVNNVTKTNNQIKLRDVQLKSTEAELIELNNRYDQVLKDHTSTQKEKKDQAEEIKRLREQRERLEKELQAKAARKAAEAEKLAQAARAGLGRVSAAGSCMDWVKAAGITDVANAMELIGRESGCNPAAVNPSSGACGVAQELPCGKSGCARSDGACQVKWMASYVSSRYGSWAAAVAHHDAKNWY